MILCCDTSALVKLFFQEDHSETMRESRREAEALAVSAVAYAEFLAATNRKMREGGLTKAAYARVIARFQTEWPGLVRIEVTDAMNVIAGRLLATYPLRGFDAIHLASALLLRDRLSTTDTRFATFDDRQRTAAAAEGLMVIPPEEELLPT